MKRSKKLSLVLMSSILTSGLTGCGDDPQEVSVFKNQQECIQGGFSAEECQRLEADARANSPKFSTREQCEEQFGKEMCSGGTDSSGSFWMPALMGFMVGNMMSSRGGSTTIINQDRDIGGKASPISNGVYNNPKDSGSFKSATGKLVKTNALGKAIVPRSTATFRGGFSGGARVSGFGG